MIFTLDIIDFQKWFVGGFRTIMFSLDETIYGFIIDLYNIFRWICGARITENALMNELATRVGFILGLIMFFYISFDFVQVLLDPDKLSDKDKGPLNIIKKFLIVIILLGTSRYIFDIMYNFQSIVLSGDGNGSIIEKLILPYDVQTENFGAAISSQFMYNFYTITDDPNAPTAEKIDEHEYDYCAFYAPLLSDTIVRDNSFAIGYECLNERYKANYGNGSSEKRFYINFKPLLSVAAGAFIFWILVMYCISVGMRVIQLVVLQVISPAAIICYLSPKKENTFTKWAKLYFATYIDVFVRIAIIDFVVLLSGFVLETTILGSDSGIVATGGMQFWIKVFMIMALLSFAKKAPELIKKLLPEGLQSGLGFGLSAKDRAGFGMMKRAIGTALGAATAAGTGVVGGIAGGNNWRNRISGAFGGLLGGLGRGGLAGAKGKSLRESFANARKNQAQSNIKRAQRIASGATLRERFGDKVKDTFGMQSAYSEVDSKLAAYDNLNSLIDSEDIVKDYEAQRIKANEALGKAQRDYDLIKSAAEAAAAKAGRGLSKREQTDIANAAAKLDSTRKAYQLADARKKAAREAVWTANQTGHNVDKIKVVFDGREWEEDAMDAAKGNNGSIQAAMETVARVGQTYSSREEFNVDRKKLQGESNKYHKNG